MDEDILDEMNIFSSLAENANYEVRGEEHRSSHNGVAKAASFNQSFLLSCEQGGLQATKKLIDPGASMRAKDSCDEGALEKAVKAGHVETVAFLYELGAFLDETYDNGDTLIHLVARRQARGPDMVTGGGEDPLPHTREARRQLETIQWLVHKFDFPFGTNDDGATALHVAAAHGHLYLVQWLVVNGGFNLHAENYMRCTPLDLAV